MKRRYAIAAIGLGAAILGGGVLTASAQDVGLATGSGSSGIRAYLSDGAEGVAELIGLEDKGAPGTLDDGKDLLPQAGISLEQAVAAAQEAVPGDLGEVDLEYYNDRLVFNVDSGSADVKIDAATGEYLGQATDD